MLGFVYVPKEKCIGDEIEKQSLKRPQQSDAVLATNSAQHVNLLVVLFVGSIAGG